MLSAVVLSAAVSHAMSAPVSAVASEDEAVGDVLACSAAVVMAEPDPSASCACGESKLAGKEAWEVGKTTGVGKITGVDVCAAAAADVAAAAVAMN